VLRIRTLTSEERETIDRLAAARCAPARTVERARIVQLAAAGRRVPAIAQTLHVTEATVRLWLKRFNAQGLPGLKDAPRSGHPATYTSEQVGAVIAAAVTNPRTLGMPFGAWTLDRLTAYLHEQKGIAMKRSRLDEILIAEGLRWRKDETWFGERVDPQFAEKRGPSPRSTPNPPPTV